MKSRISVSERAVPNVATGIAERAPKRARRGLVSLAILALLVAPLGGCGALLLIGGAGTSAVSFATGELRSSEPTPLVELDAACAIAVEQLGYEEITATRDEDSVRWQARTAGGDPVDIRLKADGDDETILRIRIGIFGNETVSRLVREQIQQAL